MTKKSTEKLLEAGYSFIRTQDVEKKDGKRIYKIKKCSEFDAWATLHNFTTNAERQRWIDDIDSDPKGMFLFEV